MRGAPLLVLALAGLVGCDSLNKVKVDNPVMPPAPPRLSMTDDRLHGDQYINDALEPAVEGTRPGEIVRVAGQTPDPTDDDLFGSQVIATVNGAPIFAAEILQLYGAPLAAARQRATDDQYRQIREEIIRRDLKSHIERKLLVESLRSTLPKEGLEKLDGFINQMFEAEVDRLKKQFQVNTTHEVEIELNKQHASLAQLRQVFGNQRMAMEYLAAKSKTNIEIGRSELLAYYETHLDDYAVAPQVKWQQIVISFKQHGGKREAFAVLEKVIDELRLGADFGELARKYSDDPAAERGGHWGWTKPGTLADAQLERHLFELEIGQIGEPIEGAKEFRLVKVNQRQPGGWTPFADVQHDIRKLLEEQAQQQASRKVLDRLYADAVIVSKYLDTPRPVAAKKDEALVLPIE